MIPYLRIENLKNHALSVGTYLFYSPYMVVSFPRDKPVNQYKLEVNKYSQHEAYNRKRVRANRDRLWLDVLKK